MLFDLIIPEFIGLYQRNRATKLVDYGIRANSHIQLIVIFLKSRKANLLKIWYLIWTRDSPLYRADALLATYVVIIKYISQRKITDESQLFFILSPWDYVTARIRHGIIQIMQSADNAKDDTPIEKTIETIEIRTVRETYSTKFILGPTYIIIYYQETT